MRVGSSSAVPAIREVFRPLNDGPEQAEATPSSGRALVTYGPEPHSDPLTAPQQRPLASFLAQLIAAAQQVPQARARRRAGFRHAASLYKVALRGPATAPRRAGGRTV